MGTPLEASGMLSGAGDWMGWVWGGQWAQTQGGLALYHFGEQNSEEV